MAPNDESTTVEEPVETEEGVEPANPEDETQSEETGEDTEQDETAEESAEAEPELQKRFTQFSGDTYEDYVPKLEEAYANMMTEDSRLKTQVRELQGRLDQVTTAVANNPQLASQLTGQAPTGQVPEANPLTNPASPVADPALMFWRSEYEKQNTEQYNAFVANHPELVTDPTLADQVNSTLATIAQTIRTTQNRQISMNEGLTMAYSVLGLPLGETKEEKVNQATKTIASQSRGKSAPVTPQATPKFNKEQLDVARTLNPGMSEKDLIAKLSEHNPT